MDLTKIFGKYVGVVIRNPDRMTCDVDPVTEEIQATGLKNGFGVLFTKNANFVPSKRCGNMVTAYIEQADAHGAAWKITRFAL
jgi:hypothetical protein